MGRASCRAGRAAALVGPLCTRVTVTVHSASSRISRSDRQFSEAKLNGHELSLALATMSLPNETLVAIFDELPSTTLAQLTLVSHRFNAVAERLLYASISIVDTVSPECPRPLRTLSCFRSIRARPYLIETIRRLQLRWQGTNAATYVDLDSACAEAAETLASLSFLEVLDVFLGPANRRSNSGGIHAIERLLYDCRFPNLRYCSLGAEWTKTPPTHPYSHLLPLFLASAIPIVRHLRLWDAHSPLYPALPPDALPLLSYFRGSADAAASILPGRPVTHLILLGQDSDINRENLPKFALGSVPLTVLDLSAIHTRPVLVREISKYLPQLEHLRIRLALRHTLHYSFTGIAILAGLTPVLGDFPNLRIFDLSPTEMYPVPHATLNNSEELALCTQWSSKCPSLRCIIFPSGREWQVNEGATTW
ncbi:F-box domain-containing protein [Mycena chlorophos]|uniref:F-box domain-containing protein n=1 Tax=Mycena chlorophos TaxID=658473 RepID=A0A8H6SZZ2_MYCCL|nr:F-box domain-containing protein [Mycena chlorophos]